MVRKSQEENAILKSAFLSEENISQEVSRLEFQNEPREKLALLRAVEVKSYPHSIVSAPYRPSHARKGDSLRVNVDRKAENVI